MLLEIDVHIRNMRVHCPDPQKELGLTPTGYVTTLKTEPGDSGLGADQNWMKSVRKAIQDATREVVDPNWKPEQRGFSQGNAEKFAHECLKHLIPTSAYQQA